MRLAYLHGLFLSTVLLALACIEQEIAGMLHAGGWDKAARTSLEVLLVEAQAQDVITEAECIAFNHLRDVRNAYAHYRHTAHPTHWVRRAVDLEIDIEGILAQDALRAVASLGAFISRRAGID